MDEAASRPHEASSGDITRDGVVVLDLVPRLGIVTDPQHRRLLYYCFFGILVLPLDDDGVSGRFGIL